MHTSPLDDPGEGDAGGMNVYVRQLSRALAAAGASVVVATRSVTGALWRQEDEGVVVWGVPAGDPGAAKEDLPALVPAFAEAVASRLADEGVTPQVVHSHYWLSGLVARRLVAAGGAAEDAVWAHTMHTMGATKNAEVAAEAGAPPEPPARIEGERAVLRAVDLAVVSTRREAQQVQAEGADPAVVRVIPPGVDAATFHPVPDAERTTLRVAARRDLGLGPDASLLVQAGRWQPAKGQLVLLEAVEHLHARGVAAHALFVGGPSGSGDAEELPRRIEASPVRHLLHAHGAVPPEQLARLFHAADLVVVPSRTESFGLVAAEAMACGVPVVAARVGGLPEAVGSAGVLVDGHDPADWARTLAALLADPAARGRLREAGARRGEQLTWAAAASAHLDAYRETDPRSPDDRP